MKLSSTEDLVKLVSKFLYRYNVLLFALLVIGGLSVVTWMLYTEYEGVRGDVSAPTRETFDQTTIDKLNDLNAAEDDTPLELPSGRINPFR